MDPWIVVVLAALMLTLLIVGGHAYSERIGKPKSRKRALEQSLDAITDHNADIAYRGKSQRIEQVKRITKGNTTPLSVLDMLSRESQLNRNGSWLKLEFHEGLHKGPFDDELTKEEWDYVDRRYSELVEQKTTHRMQVENQQRALQQNEQRLNRLTSFYVEEAKRIADEPSQDPRRMSWNEQFDALDPDARRDR